QDPQRSDLPGQVAHRHRDQVEGQVLDDDVAVRLVSVGPGQDRVEVHQAGADHGFGDVQHQTILEVVVLELDRVPVRSEKVERLVEHAPGVEGGAQVGDEVARIDVHPDHGRIGPFDHPPDGAGRVEHARLVSLEHHADARVPGRRDDL